MNGIRHFSRKSVTEKDLTFFSTVHYYNHGSTEPPQGPQGPTRRRLSPFPQPSARH